MDNNTIQIDRYLQKEMSAAESAAFENELKNNAALRDEMNLQQQLIAAVQHAGLKAEFAMAIRKRAFLKKAISWAVITVIIGVVVILLFTLKKQHYRGEGAYKKDAAAENFVISNASDTIIESKDGVVFAIPAHAFGNSSDNISIEIKTALNAYDIIKNGLSTMSNEALLKTAGMFYINGYADDKPVALQKEIAVSVPATNVDRDMQLFDGVQDSSGRVNWVHPKPIAKSLRTYDITTLDFYPPMYIPMLKELKKDHQNKVYTDSLYYSFSGYSSEVEEKEYENAHPKKANAPDLKITDSVLWGKLDSIRKFYSDTSNFHYQIDPARIRSIWDKKFNNTILATKEFEERLKYMFTLCTERYLDIYLNNLDKPLYVADSLCAKASHLYEYKSTNNKFDEFAARKDGGVMIATGMQQKLNNYFQQKYSIYEGAAEKTWANFHDSLNIINNIADEKRKVQALADFKRENNNFKEELCANITEAYKQIGQQHDCDMIPPPAKKYYNVTINTTGWKNLDVYVFESTESRQSMSYTDPVTGNTAQLTYIDISIKIENAADLDRVLVYLIPDGLSSFQRMKQYGNTFTESLNSLFKYDAVAIGFKGKETFFFKKPLPQKENVLTLLPITDAALRQAVSAYSNDKNTALITDLEYQLFDEQNIQRQLQYQKDQDFRDKIRSVIFPCGEGAWRANTDSVTIPGSK